MTNFNTIAQHILETTSLDELASADLANHLNINYTPHPSEDDVIRIENSDGLIRYFGLESNDEGVTEGYSWADYEVDSHGVEQTVAEDGGSITDANTLAIALKELAEFAK